MVAGTVLRRLILTVCLWAAALVGIAFFCVQHIAATCDFLEDGLGLEAGRTASVLAGLLDIPGVEIDEINARAAVFSIMEDKRIYAAAVLTNDRMLEGQRRGDHGECVPWDDDFVVKTVQGMRPLIREGKEVGRVEVYLPLNLVTTALDAEKLRTFGLSALLACVVTLFSFAAGWQMWRQAKRSPQRVTPTDGAAPAAAAKSLGQEENAYKGMPCIQELQCPSPGKGIASAVSKEVEGVRSQGKSFVIQRISTQQEVHKDFLDQSSLTISPSVCFSRSVGEAWMKTHASAWNMAAHWFRTAFLPISGQMAELVEAGDNVALQSLASQLEQAAYFLGARSLAQRAVKLGSVLQPVQSDLTVSIGCVRLAVADLCSELDFVLEEIGRCRLS